MYKLGNEYGSCPYGCTFCGVGKSTRVTAQWNIQRFDAKHAEYLAKIDGAFHPAVFNRGNVTVEAEFSRRTLDYVLSAFARDERVQYVSLNAREPAATQGALDWLASKNLPFPVHFILGMESFSARTSAVLGKQNEGEMERFVAKLKPYNGKAENGRLREPYVFGLDVNLVFLPELYLAEGESRIGNEVRIREGLSTDLRELLSRIDPAVPCEVNIHPYYEVDALPYKSADLNMLSRFLPELKRIVGGHNKRTSSTPTGLFVGVVIMSPERDDDNRWAEYRRLHDLFGDFNVEA